MHEEARSITTAEQAGCRGVVAVVAGGNGLPTRSGHTSVILASKVLGTPVFSPTGEKLGHVQDILLDKLSDHLAFAVLGLIGPAGTPKKYHPVPWSILDYDPGRVGYLLALGADRLKNAPAFTVDELTDNDGADARQRTDQFYNAI